MTLRTEILANTVRLERARELSPVSLERRRLARLAGAIARCCRVTIASRLRCALRGASCRAAA